MPDMRKVLKERFKSQNLAVPTIADYNALIDSTLNLRDDQFYGVWHENTPYYNGAVVFYDKAFYILEYAPNTVYCVSITPKADAHWHKVQENVADDDWFFSESKDALYANPFAMRVGIGTPNPQATLDVYAKEYGQISLQPNLKDPQLTIVNLDPACKENRLTQRVTTLAAELETDSPDGLHVYKNNKKAAVKQVQVLTINATDAAEPRVGIGTDKPESHFEVLKKDVGSVRIDGGEKNSTPSVRIHKNPATTLKLGATDTETEIVSKSEKGLFFKTRVNKDVQTHLVLSPEGNVGIGALEPSAKLHIETCDSRDGIIKLGFCYNYPVLQLINDTVPSSLGTYTNAFSIGTTTDEAVLKTDSEKGFAFKKVGKSDSSAADVCDLNEGDTLMRLHSTGSLTIGKIKDSDFKLDVLGSIHAYGLYLEADSDKVDPAQCKPLGDVLTQVCDLRPVTFKWLDSTLTGKWEIGLLSKAVKAQFPEVVVNESVAYQNLVPVLIKAIQEQQKKIDDLTTMYSDLNKRLCKLEGITSEEE